LEDDIESLDCYCGQDAQLATQVLPLKPNAFDSIASFVGVGTAVNRCNLWVHTFNRIPTSERPCAILFEGEDCETGLTNWHLEILPTNGIINLPELSLFHAKADSAEAVLVRPGCTFTGYDEDDGKGKKITVSAPAGIKFPKFEPLGSKYNPFGTGLKEDIDSYKCTC